MTQSGDLVGVADVPLLGPPCAQRRSAFIFTAGVMAGTLGTAHWPAACFSYQMTTEPGIFGKTRKRLAGGTSGSHRLCETCSGPA